jgi:hypothetical protein
MKTQSLIAGTILATALLSTAAFADNTVSPAVSTPNEVVYVPQLPNVADLTKAAAAQGVTIAQIDQTASQIVVTYKYSNGQTNTVAYEPLSAAEANGVPVPTVAPGTAAAVPATTVVYQTVPAYYYGSYYPYAYAPWGWYPPVAIGIGFGFHGGGFRGGFGGHFR